MARVRSRDTKPERIVRRATHAMGYRYRLHGKLLPGKPDLVFASRRKVIFVHGCFWHQHGCDQYRMPRTRTEFWREKLDRNVSRDEEVKSHLARIGWRYLVIWECELSDMAEVAHKIRNFLEA